MSGLAEALLALLAFAIFLILAAWIFLDYHDERNK